MAPSAERRRPVALRVGIGTIFLVHGTQKRQLWKTQPSAQMPAGFLRTLRFLSIAEPAGGLAVLVGFLTQPAALGLSLVMLGAIRFKIVQMHKGFSGNDGWEFESLILLVAIAWCSGSDSAGFSGPGQGTRPRALAGGDRPAVPEW